LSTAEILHAEWVKEGEFEGHTPQRTMLYASLMGELYDRQHEAAVRVLSCPRTSSVSISSGAAWASSCYADAVVLAARQ
jgi:hypothetical protein